jgi:hypothetical protein
MRRFLRKIVLFHTAAEKRLLQEAGVGTLRLEQGASLLLDPGRQRELDLCVVHLLHGRATGVLGGDRLHADDLGVNVTNIIFVSTAEEL